MQKGVDCECCGRFIKINRKRLNATMMQYLDKLYERRNEGWFLISRVRIKAKGAANLPGEEKETQTGDYAILGHWGLAEYSGKQGEAKITQLGIEFVEGRATVRESVIVENYKNRLVSLYGPFVSVEQARSTHFDRKDMDWPDVLDKEAASHE